MKRATLSWILPLALLAASCELVTGSGAVSTEAGLSVRASSGRLVLRNASAVPVHYVAIEEQEAALVELYHDPSRWPSVPPRAELRIPYSEVMGYERGGERAVVHWWTKQHGWNLLRIELR